MAAIWSVALARDLLGTGKVNRGIPQRNPDFLRGFPGRGALNFQGMLPKSAGQIESEVGRLAPNPEPALVGHDV